MSTLFERRHCSHLYSSFFFLRVVRYLIGCGGMEVRGKEQAVSDRRKKMLEVNLDLSKKSTNATGKSLVGRIMTDRLLNKPTVVSMIKKGWQLNEEVEIRDLDRAKSIFLFNFNKEEDVDRILKGRPWTIQGHLLSLKKWDEHMFLSEVDFFSALYWIQFHGLPLAAFDVESAKILGNVVGETLIVEKPNIEGKIQRSFIRVCSLLDLREPLIPEFLVPRENLEPARVSVKYERLQNFCYGCGRIGHEVRSCKEKLISEGGDVHREFGPWMSAFAIKTHEKNLVVCKEGWAEAMKIIESPVIIGDESPMPAKVNCSVLEDVTLRAESSSNHKNNGDQLQASDKEYVLQKGHDFGDLSPNNNEILIIPFNDVNQNESNPSQPPMVGPQLSSNFMKDARRQFMPSKPKIIVAQDKSLVNNVNAPASPTNSEEYVVDHPDEIGDMSKDLITSPNLLSPISTVTLGLMRMNIKRPRISSLDEDNQPNKRRFFLPEQVEEERVVNPLPVSQRNNRKSIHTLKNLIRLRHSGKRNEGNCFY